MGSTNSTAVAFKMEQKMSTRLKKDLENARDALARILESQIQRLEGHSQRQL
jgi:hypothetical protein